MDTTLRRKVRSFLAFLGFPAYILHINDPYDISEYYKSKKEWGSADSSGVYAFYSKDSELLYIGESVNIGRGLADYFQNAEDKTGKSLSPESEGIKWVVTIGFQNNHWFLGPALERFLIHELKPKRNRTIKD